MAAYIQFTRIGETEPMPLNEVDEVLCEVLGKPVHPTKWVDNWFNLEGLSLACGGTVEQLKADFPDRNIAQALEEHFRWNCWHGR